MIQKVERRQRIALLTFPAGCGMCLWCVAVS